VAPSSLKPLVMRGLDREIDRARKGEPAQVFMKMNSLTDRDVIDKISEACKAGVAVVMIIRGITCIKANIPGRTEGLVIRQIVGRFLEHARVYAFGVETDLVYLSSADMMTRNTEHRVEIAYPVLDDHCRSLVMQYVNLQLADNAKARQLTSEGTWEKVTPEPGEPTINSQELLISVAEMRAEADESELAPMTPFTRIIPELSLDQLRRVSSIPSHMFEEDDAEEATPEVEPEVKPEAEVEVEAEPEPELEAADESPVESVEPEDETPQEAEAAAEPEHVQAHIIEDEEPEDEKPAEEPAQTRSEPKAASDPKPIAKRKPGRFAVGFKLIAMGIKAIFTGRVTDRKDQ
jgi:polyphosphate kinase